ncbi:MAG: hypothetical protein ACRBFS_23280 [Aureispira sp.]
MNKEIQHLYAELSAKNKEELWKDYEASPKMLRYLHLLEGSELVHTPKAIQVIYEEEKEETSQVLTNRFYKLRKVLRIKLLDKLKNVLSSHTEEEIELKFLQLLLLKNEHAYVLTKAQKLEKKYWEANLFELLPDLIHLIICALHFHKAHGTNEVAEYIEKLELASKLQYNLYQFKNYVNSFRTQVLDVYNMSEIIDHYTETTTKMQRKSNALKAYPRFRLIYHHTSFTIGAHLQDIVHKSGNVLTRHVNQIEKMLSEHPDMPVTDYVINHRLYFLNKLFLYKAIYWYQKGKSKKSYQCILDDEQLRIENPTIYLPRSGVGFANILLCCWGAKEYKAMLKYTEEFKVFQINNTSVKAEVPYFIYELLAYTGLYPKEKHPNPIRLITMTEKFLATADENSTWIYGALGTFTLLYGEYERSRRLLEYPPLVKEYQQVDYNIDPIELLDAVEENSYEALMSLIKKIRVYRKKNTNRDVLTHLKELEMLTKTFL